MCMTAPNNPSMWHSCPCQTRSGCWSGHPSQVYSRSFWPPCNLLAHSRPLHKEQDNVCATFSPTKGRCDFISDKWEEIRVNKKWDTGVKKGRTLCNLTPLHPQHSKISHFYLHMIHYLKEITCTSTVHTYRTLKMSFPWVKNLTYELIVVLQLQC